MSARSTYGLTASISGSTFLALLDCPEFPELEAIEPLDDSRHSDTDGIARFVPSKRKEYSQGSFLVNDVTGCPGIAAAVAAVGGAAVAVVITNAESGGVVTLNALIQSCKRGASPLTGKQERTIVFKVTPIRA